MILKTVLISTAIVIDYAMGHLLLSLKETQWKLRQEHDQNFSIEGMLLY